MCHFDEIKNDHTSMVKHIIAILKLTLLNNWKGILKLNLPMLFKRKFLFLILAGPLLFLLKIEAAITGPIDDVPIRLSDINGRERKSDHWDLQDNKPNTPHDPITDRRLRGRFTIGI